MQLLANVVMLAGLIMACAIFVSAPARSTEKGLLLFVLLNSALLFVSGSGRLGLVYLLLATCTLLLLFFWQPLSNLPCCTPVMGKKDLLSVTIFLIAIIGIFTQSFPIVSTNDDVALVRNTEQIVPVFVFSAGVLVTLIVGVANLNPRK